MRLFTFGCSFTNYKWPTWADIIIKEKGSGENWGLSGASNEYIFHAFNECCIENNINANDIVIIMWSTLDRVGYYKNNKWICGGSVYNNDMFSEEYVKNFTDDRGFMIKNYSYIFAIDQILQKIGCQYYFLSMMDINYTSATYNKKTNLDIIKKYNLLLKKIRPSVFEIIFNKDWESRPNIKKDLTNPRSKKFIEQLTNQIKDEYNYIKGVDWPNFEDFYNNKNLKNIKKSILEEIEFYNKRIGWKKLKHEYFRFDQHPTPAEHLEYLDKALPEIEISKNTRNWVNEIDEKVIFGEDISQLWVNTQVKRW